MINQFKKLAAISTLAMLATGGAQASIIGITASGGSEVLLNIVNNADSSSVSLDLGTQISGLTSGGFFTLPQGALDFIGTAGGLSGIRFSVVGGGGTNGTSTASYLHSTDNASLTNIANGVRGTWFTNLNNLVTNRLNASNPADTDTAVNGLYGPFASGVNGNYVTNGTDDWGTAGTCVANDNACNLVAGTELARLFVINFGTSPTGFAGISEFGGGLLASLNLDAGRLEVAAVPLPAGFWLAATAFGLAGARMRRRRAN